MKNIEELKPLIIDRLNPLHPDKIILFGRYAYGIRLLKNAISNYFCKKMTLLKDMRSYKLKLQKSNATQDKAYHLYNLNLYRCISNLPIAHILKSGRKDEYLELNMFENLIGNADIRLSRSIVEIKEELKR